MKQKRQAPPRPSKFRRHWLLSKGTVFLNHGSFGACPIPVLERQAELRRQMEAEPVQFLWRRYEERLEPARAALAEFVGARARELVFVTNATTGVNAVVRSLKLRAGDELLTTSHDYNACHNVLEEAARAARAQVVIADVPFPIRTMETAVEAILGAVTRRTRLAVLDHVTSNTALAFPIGRLIRELEAKGVDCLIDGAHAPGMLSLDLGKLNPAYYAANLHKWVCAPKGAAFLWVREDKQAGLQPAVISHGNNIHRPGYTAFQDRFDWAGTFDPTAWLCVPEAIDWLSRLLPGGWSELRETNHGLAVRGRRILCEALGVEPACPERLLGAMATILLPERFQKQPRSGKIDAEQLQLYDEFGIEVPFMRHGPAGLRCIRISAHIHNSIEEYEFLGQAIARLRD